MMIFRTCLKLILVLVPGTASSGTVVGTVSTKEVNLDVTCEVSGANLQARSNDPGWKDEDTNGDGYFFKGGVIGGVAGFVYVEDGEKFTFGDHQADDLGVSAAGLIFREKIHNRDGSSYDVDLEIVC
ncbi:MAG: hypothetical protein ACU0GG_05620 [Paracoccaceae bacterium]